MLGLAARESAKTEAREFMSEPAQQRGPYFTPAARLAATAARKRRFEDRGPLDQPQIFVVRSAPEESRYRWEIRKFGGILLERSLDVYDSQAAARRAAEGVIPPGDQAGDGRSQPGPSGGSPPGA